MMRRLARALLVSLVVMLHAGVSARAADPITVQSFTSEGSGCPPGTVAVNISPDGSSFTLLFDSYVASAGPGVPRRDGARECVVDAVLHAPEGWSWAIVGVEHRGFVQLQAGMSATLRSSFQFNRQKADHRQAPPFEAQLVGPLSEEYLLTAETPPLQIDWSECDGTSELHVKMRLAVTAAAGSTGVGLLTLDSLDGEIAQPDGTSVCGYRLVWRRCD